MADAPELKVLLIDDEPRIRTVLSALIADLGHRVTAAANPQEAREAVLGGAFDIVLTDQYLGPVLGLDLMRELQTLDGSLYFIIMTGNGTTDLAVEALRRGAADFLVKPFFADDIMRSFAYVLKKRDLDQERRGMMRELEIRVAEQTAELIEVNFAVLASLARAVETKDLGTYGHSMRVGGYADLIAKRLGIPAKEREKLRAAAMLHDIGKIGISETVLGKPGPLSGEEMVMVRKHPENGVAILRPLSHYHDVLPVILHHHEHLDGSGYPHGLMGRSIPLLARIISVADAYDAIVSDRPYRKAGSHEQALAELLRMAGKQFDADVVHIFADVLATDRRPQRAGTGALMGGAGCERGDGAAIVYSLQHRRDGAE
ncbi:MAG: HD domain-containing phosphohydrolase [Nitrospirota bacterium]